MTLRVPVICRFLLLVSACSSLLLPISRCMAQSSGKPAVVALTLTPERLTLQGAYAEMRVLVTARNSAGTALDAGEKAVLTLADPKIASIDENGIVRPLRDGKTILTATFGGRSVSASVLVRGVAKANPPRFLGDVMPVLTKASCNMGGCHGAASGKGGFKLSLLGYDPEADYEAITRLSFGRRISRSQPDNSLLLRKPALVVAHKGGLRLRVGSPEYRLLRDWIAKGLPGPDPKEAQVARLEVFPKVKTLKIGQTQRFIVKARYSDGSLRDATAQTLFTASDESVAKVAPNGTAMVTGNGEGAVVIRYQGLVATARVISPYGVPRNLPAQSSLPLNSLPEGKGIKRANPVATAQRIDSLVDTKLAALGLNTSRACSDADFLRRVYLDVIGILPKPEEARAFLASHDPNKRAALIESLLNRPEYVDFWSLKWGDILRSNRNKLSEKGMYAFNGWIRHSVETNKPWNQFAQELLLAQGSAFERGEANYFRTAGTPQELAETTSQVFLGVRIQCARCHNHPYEKWTQNQYYQMAAFFARMKSKGGERPGESVVFLADGGEVKHPKTQKDVAPCALDAKPIKLNGAGDRRETLAGWLTSAQNPFFAHSLVNRLWKHLLGRGLVEPVDDLRATNPPSNEALFDFLATDFVRNGYDLKYLMRSILSSRTYQRSAEPVKGNAQDTRYYSHYLFKRLGAEQMMDALTACTGVPEKFDGFPSGLRAAQLPDTGVPSYFLDLFGRPARNVTCECERVDEPNLGQILHLMNNAGLNGRIAAKNGRVAQLIETKKPEKQMIEDLYLASLSRLPSAAEGRSAMQLFAASKEKKAAAEDLLWALINSKEFLFNH